MKIIKNDLKNAAMPAGEVRKITYSNGGVAYVFKKETAYDSLHKCATTQKKFPPVNRNEPMTKTAYRRTLNRYFGKLIELDLDPEKCLSLTLTIRRQEHNTYERITERFKDFTNKVRFSKKVGNSYVGAVRFIEVQQKGFFHIHCVLVFNSTVRLGWKDLHRMWGWGFVKVTTIYYFIGLMDYLTNPKCGSESQTDSKFTRYPKGAKIIYISPNLPRGKSENITLTAQECAALMQDERTIGHIKLHKYFDSETQSVRPAIDKMVLVQILKKGGLRK